jgi:hypothetical protein
MPWPPEWFGAAGVLRVSYSIWSARSRFGRVMAGKNDVQR